MEVVWEPGNLVAETVERLELQAGNIADGHMALAVQNEWLTSDGTRLESLGLASTRYFHPGSQPLDGSLVSDIGSSGQDGVRLSPGAPDEALFLRWLPPHTLPSASDGSGLGTSWAGPAGSASVSLDCTVMAGQLSLSMDAASWGSSTATVSVYSGNGSLQGQLPSIPLTALGELTRWPASLGITLSDATLWLELADGTEYRVQEANGKSGDLIIFSSPFLIGVTPTSPVGVPSVVGSASLRATGMTSFLVAEFVSRAPTAAPGNPKRWRTVLHPPAPNPFNPRTEISFDLAQPGNVDVLVYNVAGRLVRSLLRGRQLPVGSHSIMWDGRDDSGVGLASGAYLVRLQSPQQDLSRKVLLLK
jgi:hypothetical protein